MEKITLTVNGQPMVLPQNITIAGLISHLNLRPDHIAVAVNDQVTEVDHWEARTLKVGEQVEIVHFVGGG